MGSLSLFQGTFPTQGSNPGLPHCRWILYQLSHKGGPRIPEWVFFSSGSSLPGSGIEPGSPELQMDSLPTELSVKPFESESESCSVVSDSLQPISSMEFSMWETPLLKVVLSQRSVLGLKSPSLSGKAFPQLDLWKNTSILTSE